MGMFTQLSHNGEIYQFKTGWDDLVVYQVGDTIPWEPDPRYPGEHIDGAYPACDDTGKDALWVIIKGGQIFNVCPQQDGDTQAKMRELYDIQPPPRELWSDLAWAEKAARDAQRELAYQRYVAEHPGATPLEYYMHCKLQERSFMQQILPPVKGTNYTPGPWHASKDRDSRGVYGWRIDSASRALMAWLAWPDEQERDSTEATSVAHLIAAAPELLEALEEMVRIFNPDKQGIYEFARPATERGRQVIKKVRGE